MPSRRVHAHAFDQLARPETLWRAYLAYRRGKRRRPAVAAFELDADVHVHALSHSLLAGTYTPQPFSVTVIHDPKTRVIAAPAIRDRILHQALLETIGPAYSRSFLPDSFAWGVGRGPHRAVLRHLRYARQFRHRIGLDVRRYFPSVHHDTLVALLERRVRERRMRRLLRAITRHGGTVYRHPLAVEALDLAHDPVPRGCGLAIGTYWSQWCGSLYLDGFDHFVKRELKIPGYIRFMDDFVLFANDPGHLREAWSAATHWLAAERRLTLKPCPAGVQPTREPVTFLGYRISRGGLRPGPKIRRNLPRRLRAAKRRGRRAVERTLASYRGLWVW